jgi:bacterioferritin-associated ferredoxin
MYVCICNGITDRDVRDAARAGASDLSDLSAMTGCSTVCGSCGELAMDILRDARSDLFSLPLLAAA